MKKHNPMFLVPLFAVLVLALSLAGSAGAPAAASEPAAPGGVGVVIPPGSPVELALANSLVISEAADLPLAVAMAIDDYGDIQGFDVSFLGYDTGCSTGSAATMAASIVAAGNHPGVIGPLCSSSVIGAAPVFDAAELVMISGSATAVGLEDFGPNVFNRTVVPDPAYPAWNAVVDGYGPAAAWEADFETLHGHAPWEIARYVYDATMLLLTRIDEVATVDGGGNLVIDRQELAAAVRMTTAYPGITTNIALDALGTRIDQFQSAVWVDGFDSPSLDPTWGWIDEDPAKWSLTDHPGFLRIVTQTPPSNRLVVRAPDGDFEIRTRLQFAPVENFQFAGLSIFQDGDNFLHFGRAHCDIGTPPCAPDGVYFDYTEGGVFEPENYATTVGTPGDVYLRLVRSGNDFTAYYSENGSTWNEVGTHTIGFNPMAAGLHVSGQGSAVETPADFDFFVMEYEGFGLFLPIVVRE